MEADKILDMLSYTCPILLALIPVVILIAIVFFDRKHRNIPPGPTGIPYLGYWPFLNNENITVKMGELKKKYGDIFSLTITGRLFIHLGSNKAIREAHISKAECFDGRLPYFSFLEQFFENGIGFAKGERWKVLRKFFMTVLRNRGSMLGEKIVITTVYDSIKSIVNDLRQEMGKPVNLIQFLTHKCTANIRLMLFGEVGASEEQIQRITKLHAEELGAMTPLNLLLSGPLARYLIFPSQPAFCKALKCHREMERILFDIVKDHKDTYDKENARDIIDDYFVERDLRQSKGDVTAKYFSDFCLVQTLTQFVSEGVLAIALTINILIKFIIEKPEEQEKIYQEIMEVVGLDRQPTIEDRSKLTYLNAFIYEGMRASSVFSIFPGWECTKETTLNGYRIPKGSVTLINFHSCKNDPEVYEKPEKFNPSRFIPTEEKRSAELPIVFGVGKRSCLGEGFALTQIFLFLATILQNFELKFPDDTNLSSRQVYMTRNLLVCARPRSYI